MRYYFRAIALRLLVVANNVPSFEIQILKIMVVPDIWILPRLTITLFTLKPILVTCLDLFSNLFTWNNPVLWPLFQSLDGNKNIDMILWVILLSFFGQDPFVGTITIGFYLNGNWFGTFWITSNNVDATAISQGNLRNPASQREFPCSQIFPSHTNLNRLNL